MLELGRSGAHGTPVGMAVGSAWQGTGGGRLPAERGTGGPWSTPPSRTAEPPPPGDHVVVLRSFRMVLTDRRYAAAAA